MTTGPAGVRRVVVVRTVDDVGATAVDVDGAVDVVPARRAKRSPPPPLHEASTTSPTAMTVRRIPSSVAPVWTCA